MPHDNNKISKMVKKCWYWCNHGDYCCNYYGQFSETGSHCHGNGCWVWPATLQDLVLGAPICKEQIESLSVWHEDNGNFRELVLSQVLDKDFCIQSHLDDILKRRSTCSSWYWFSLCNASVFKTSTLVFSNTQHEKLMLKIIIHIFWSRNQIAIICCW